MKYKRLGKGKDVVSFFDPSDGKGTEVNLPIGIKNIIDKINNTSATLKSVLCKLKEAFPSKKGRFGIHEHVSMVDGETIKHEGFITFCLYDGNRSHCYRVIKFVKKYPPSDCKLTCECGFEAGGNITDRNITCMVCGKKMKIEKL